MHVQPVPDAHVAGREHEGVAIVHKSHVADQGFVDDRVDQLTVEGAAFLAATEGGAGGGLEQAHGSDLAIDLPSVPAYWILWQVQFGYL